MAGEKDFFYGYDLKRNNVVPGWFIELDFNLTGGQLYQLLEMTKTIYPQMHQQLVVLILLLYIHLLLNLKNTNQVELATSLELIMLN